MLRAPFILALTWTIIVTLLLCIPGSEFPKISWLTRIGFDKWVHIGFFLLLVIFWCRTLKYKNLIGKKDFLMITILSFIYGVLMEVIQHYLISFRSFDIGDILADAAGALLGFGYVTYWYIKKNKPL